jgi:TonB family protein
MREQKRKATLRLLLMLAGMLTLASGNAAAEGVKVIANLSVKPDAISVAELKNVFLEEKNSLGDGTAVHPVLERSGAAHLEFLQRYLDRSDDDLQTYYRSLAFTGTGSMPKAVGSDAEVVAYVAKTKGSIGYVGIETNTSGVKTLSVLRVAKGSQRMLITRVEPKYPLILQEHAIGGMVRMQVSISAKGNVEDVSLLGGDPILAQSATAAVLQWRFAAARNSTSMEISIPFDPQQ